MKSVVVKLQNYIDKASETEKGIIEYLLKNPDSTVNSNIYQLSEKTFSSPSTIIRLCKKTGFKGYKDLIHSLVYELAIRKSTEKERVKNINKEDSLENIVEKVTLKSISSLEKTGKLIDIKVLETCVSLLDKSRNICLFGVGASLLVAKDAHLKLLRINKSCYINDDFHAQLLQAQNMSKDDLAIIISYSGFTEEMIKCANIVKEIGAPIIAITRLEESPISRIADYRLLVPSTELVFREGAISSRIAQLNIIDILYTAFVNKHYDSNIQQFNRTHIQKPNLFFK